MWHVKNNVSTEFLGLSLRSAAGSRGKLLPGAGFVTLNPPGENVLEWTLGLGKWREKAAVAVNITSDILRYFSLVYDFTDLIIIDPDGDSGIDSMDISDTSLFLDEIVNLRLCYERYTPVALRLTHGHTPEEIKALVAHCRLSGIDAVVAPGPAKVQLVTRETEGRFPVIGAATSLEEALACRSAGAAVLETAIGPIGFHKLLKAISGK